MKNKSFQLLIFLLFFNSNISGQVYTNLEIFKILSDSISNKIIQNLTYQNSNIQLEFLGYHQLNILSDFIRVNLIKRGNKLSSENSFNEKVSLIITEASVLYEDLFKEHIFDKFQMIRNIRLSGNLIISNSNKIVDFNYTHIDTIDFDNYKILENKLYPFTVGLPPKEPFFLTIIEPVVAIVASATAIILFFTIRSK